MAAEPCNETKAPEPPKGRSIKIEYVERSVDVDSSIVTHRAEVCVWGKENPEKDRTLALAKLATELGVGIVDVAVAAGKVVVEIPMEPVEYTPPPIEVTLRLRDSRGVPSPEQKFSIPRDSDRVMLDIAFENLKPILVGLEGQPAPENKPCPNDFAWAMDRVANGFSVRRAQWSPHVRLRLERGCLSWLKGEVGDVDIRRHVMIEPDIKATDWQIYSEPGFPSPG